MATAKTKKVTTKKPAAKKATAKIDESRKIRGYKGQDHHFYKGFPRGEAYEILVSAKNSTMLVKTFLDKIEKLPKVTNRKQAQGIVQKLIGKPNDAGEINTIAKFV